LGLFALSGCGFSPVYQYADELRGAFTFDVERSVVAFAARNRLEDRLGSPAAARFTLKARLDLSERAASITAEGDTARINVVGAANWSVIETATGQELARGTVNGFTSYATTGSTVATQTTRDDARTRLAIILADMIVTRILSRAELFAT